MSEIELTGLDGMNPLGFMAALGTLRALADRHRQEPFPERPRLAWRNEGSWVPVIRGPADADALAGALLVDLESWRGDAALQLQYEKPGKDGKVAWDLKPPPGVFASYLRGLLDHAGPDARRSVDLAAALATDVATDHSGNTKPTALHFTAGQQELLRMVNELLHGKGKVPPVGEADLREALFGPWTYARPLPVLQWDATASRDYALRAGDPSAEKKQGVPGADWLAFRGLPCFTAVPIGQRIATTACFGGWKTGYMQWPLWTVWLESRTASTTLALDVAGMTPREREARGVAIVLQSSIKRTDQGGYGSFTPPKLA